jgi:hypothetical protein
MPRQSAPFFRLNSGEISKSALARVDLEKMRMAASSMVNMQPLATGGATLRPGLQYIGGISGDDPCKLLEFVYATDDAALIELTDSTLRVWDSDALVARETVTSTIQAFASWTLTAGTGASVTVGTYNGSANNLIFKDVTRKRVSIAYGTINSTSNHNKVHGLRIPVTQGGELVFKIGTTQGDDDVFPTTMLGTGTHSIAFTPTVNTLYVQFESKNKESFAIAPMSLESGGTMTLPTPWLEADLPNIQYDQSADVIYVACDGYQQRKIERRQNNSWSIVLYEPVDGPFPAEAGDDSFIFTPYAVSGDTTLSCSKAFFDSSIHTGALIRLFHNQQYVNERLNAAGAYTDPIRVSGTGAYTGAAGTVTSLERQMNLTLTGTWAGTINLQRTFDPDGLDGWVTIPSGGTLTSTWTANTSTTFNDQMNNVIVWYRLFMTAYTSGTATAEMGLASGGGAGIARILSVTNSTTASIRVLKPFLLYNPVPAFSVLGGALNWRLSEWNAGDGFPSAVSIHESRLWWAGNSQVWGSESDAYETFDFDGEGDASTISRSIGRGPVSNIRWLVPAKRLVIGTDGGAVTAKSSSLDEPLTPSNFNLSYSVTQGVSNVRPVNVDSKTFYVQRSGRRIYGLAYSSNDFDFSAIDVTRLNTDIGLEGFVDAAVQRQLDTHIRLPLGDGTMANLLYDEGEELSAWWRVETDGEIENVAVLPGTLEDAVYVVVKRTIDGNTKRYLEKFARLDECEGASVCKLADSFYQYSGVSTATISGLDHLEGEAVVVWAGGGEVGFDATDPTTITTYTVSSGSITLPAAVTSAVIGLPYTGRFISAKLAYAAGGGTALNRKKKVHNMGLILINTHYQGVRVGHYHNDPSVSVLRSMPLIERGKETTSGTVWSIYDESTFPIPGEWDTDSRFQIECRAPRPATILGLTLDVTTSG